MKTIKYLALMVCCSALWVGCASDKSTGSAYAASCGMQCCTDAKSDCAHCPMCSKK